MSASDLKLLSGFTKRAKRFASDDAAILEGHELYIFFHNIKYLTEVNALEKNYVGVLSLHAMMAERVEKFSKDNILEGDLFIAYICKWFLDNMVCDASLM